MTGTGMAHDDQNALERGHLPTVTYGVRCVGRTQVNNPSGAGLERHICDLAAYGNHAFLTAYREPTCERTGAYVIDISDPQAPFEVESAFMETTTGNYVGEGPGVIEVDNEYFSGVLFVHGNEIYAQAHAPDPTGPRQRGGINIWDITDPEHAQLLAAHAGDYTDVDGSPLSQAVEVYYVFPWTNSFTGRTYVAMVTVKITTDICIMDITDPRNPTMVNSLDLRVPPFGVGQESPAGLNSLFGHAVDVTRTGDRYVMSATYWDGGYVLLDVTDPTPGNVSMIAQSFYAELDEERAKHGHQVPPEGNAEHCALSPDAQFLVGADENYEAVRLLGTITSGPDAGLEFTAAWSPDTAPIDDNGLSGTPAFVGNGCPGTVRPGRGIALIERDASLLTAGSNPGCSFQEKLEAVAAAGYSAGIVFNRQGPDALHQYPTSAKGPIPLIFVNRLTGLRLLGVTDVTEETAGSTPTPDAPDIPAIDLRSVFNGWGYLRLFRTLVPAVGSGSIEQIDTYAIPESQDPKYAIGFGDLSASHVAIDPDRRLVYATFYSGGLRVLSYGPDGLREVGAYCEPGNDFVGVVVHKIGGKNYALVTDRNYGLYVFDV
ncbi:PA domain-containing protein [Kitasatospora sp. NPDC087314]|uniref:PA domain-containing protein n=1 Tax=Kitasatospora sp. NPDC087314 TaxID=3364068 RepID=UPI003818B534